MINNRQNQTLNQLYDPEFLEIINLQPLTPLLYTLYNGMLQTEIKYQDNLIYIRSTENVVSSLENPSLRNSDLMLRQKHILEIIMSKIKYYYIQNETTNYLHACLYIIHHPIYSELFINKYS